MATNKEEHTEHTPVYNYVASSPGLLRKGGGLVHTAGVLVRMRIFPHILGKSAHLSKISVDLLRKLVVYCRVTAPVRSVRHGHLPRRVQWSVAVPWGFLGFPETTQNYIHLVHARMRSGSNLPRTTR